MTQRLGSEYLVSLTSLLYIFIVDFRFKKYLHDRRNNIKLVLKKK